MAFSVVTVHYVAEQFSPVQANLLDGVWLAWLRHTLIKSVMYRAKRLRMIKESRRDVPGLLVRNEKCPACPH